MNTLQNLIKSTECMQEKNQLYFGKIHGIMYFNDEITQQIDINEYNKPKQILNNNPKKTIKKQDDLLNFKSYNQFSNNKYLLSKEYDTIVECIYASTFMKFFPKQKLSFDKVINRYNLNVLIVDNKSITAKTTELYNPLLCIYKHKSKYYLMSDYQNQDVFLKDQIEYSYLIKNTLSFKKNESTIETEPVKINKTKTDIMKMSAKEIQQECENLNIDLYHLKNEKKKKKVKKQLINELCEYYQL